MEYVGDALRGFAYFYTAVSIGRLALKGWTREIMDAHFGATHRETCAKFGADQIGYDQKLGQYTRMKDAEAYRRMRETVEQ